MSDRSLLAADDERYALLAASDCASLERLLTDDFTYTHATGFIEGKGAYLERIRSGTVRYSDGKRLSHSTRILRGTGIMSGEMWMRATLANRVIELDNLFLAVWQLHEGIWHLAAWASTARRT